MGMIYHKKRMWAKLKEKEGETLPFSDSDIEFEERSEEQQYTKTDIQRMSKDDLVSLAIKMGIDGAEEMSGADLKRELVEKLGL